MEPSRPSKLNFMGFLFRPLNVDLVSSLLLSVRFHANVIPILFISSLLYIFSQLSAGSGSGFSLIVFVFFAGAVGGITNTYIRLKNMPIETLQHSPLSNIIAISQVYATPIVAGTFAIVAHALFASELLNGALFPTFAKGGSDYTNLGVMFHSYKPETYADAAKMIVWGFIAGFSEKMVPNILDRLAEEGKKSGTEKNNND